MAFATASAGLAREAAFEAEASRSTAEIVHTARLQLDKSAWHRVASTGRAEMIPTMDGVR
jgi:hypothetical protein